MLDLAEVRAGQSVLDVACGTGVVAVGAERRVGPSGFVVGLDNNPAMLAVASRSETGVTWREGDAQALPLPDSSFDRVICQLGLQYFPDRPAAVREMHRVLRPGGQVVVLVWRDVEHSAGYAALVKALEDIVSREAADVMRAPFVFGDDPTPIVSLLQDAGLADVTAQVRSGTVEFTSARTFIRAQIGGSPLAGHVDVHDEQQLANITDAVAAALGRSSTEVPVRFRIEAHLVRAARNENARESRTGMA